MSGGEWHPWPRKALRRTPRCRAVFGPLSDVRVRGKATETDPGALTCGANPGSPVTPDYASPFKFTGTLHEVTVDVSGELIHDPEAGLRAHMARQ
jgi:hypothetical protein